MARLSVTSAVIFRNRSLCSCHHHYGQVRYINFNIFKRGGSDKDKEPPPTDEASVVKSSSDERIETRKVSPWAHLSSEEIMKIRNKSRLPRDIVCEIRGIPEHGTRFYRLSQYKREYFALYGEASGLKPGVCWPSKQELEFRKKFEATFMPPLDKLIEQDKRERQQKEAELKKYRSDIMKNLKQLPKVKEEFFRKLEEKERLEEEERLKREKIIQDVREYLGYDIAPGDTRFQEALDKMEEEQKEQKKVSKKKELQAKVMAQLAQLAEEQIKKVTGEDASKEDSASNKKEATSGKSSPEGKEDQIDKKKAKKVKESSTEQSKTKKSTKVETKSPEAKSSDDHNEEK